LVAVAFFMESLDSTILNTAVPTISAALNVVPLDMKAVLSSYTLSLAVFIPISGWMADRFGTRRVFAAAIGMFTLASALCGLANDIHTLVACRILQGFGGAMMVPVGRMTLVRSFAKSDLIRVMSFVSIPAWIGPLVGPALGGLLVGYAHWRAIFFVNVPIGLIGLLMVYLHLPDYRESEKRPLDIIGLVLLGSGVALLSYVLEVFGNHTLSTREILSLLAIAIVLIGSYGFHAARMEFPLLKLELFRIRTFSTAVTGSFVTRIGIGGTSFLLPLMYQVGLGLTPLQSGLLIMPQAIAALSTKFLSTKSLTIFGYKAVLITNTMIVGAGLMAFATIGPSRSMWDIAAQVFVYGIFTSLQYTSMNTLVYADVDAKSTSAAGSISSTLQQMSMSFGVAMAGLVTALFIPESVRSDPHRLVQGIHEAFLLLGGFTILSSLTFWRLRKGDGTSVSQQKVETQAAVQPASGEGVSAGPAPKT
jgi:EmrB/QacA subfamily drug resistance transporter